LAVLVIIGLTEGGDFGDGVWKFDDEAQFTAHWRFSAAVATSREGHHKVSAYNGD
jgi:hypothetical protein